MPRKGANISLSSYDDIFETDESRADSQLEKVQKIPINELVPFKNHPFMESAHSNGQFCGAKRTRCGASGLT